MGDKTCDLCDADETLTPTDVEKEDTGITATANLCPDCNDKAVRYGRGEDVDWSGIID